LISSRLLPPGWDNALLLALHLAVLLLPHDGQIVAIELGLRVEGQKLLLGVFGVELDEDAALPVIVLVTAPTHHDGSIGLEKVLEGNLARLFQISETLHVDTGVKLVLRSSEHAIIQFLETGLTLLVAFPRRDWERLLALNGLFARAAEFTLVQEDEALAVPEGSDDSRIRLEAAHALERGDVLDWHGTVVRTLDLKEEVSVGGEVVHGEVELDLYQVSRVQARAVKERHT
jgi:hypothetical protein